METKSAKPIVIAGLCVLESEAVVMTTAERIAGVARHLGTEIIFKASFDKANRTSLHSYRGVLEQAAETL